MTRKVDTVWKNIIDDYDILNQIDMKGMYRITADDIRKYNEPRLVTKFDCKNALPEIFKENNISILPDTTGTYLLGHFNIFKDFPEETDEIIPVSFPSWIESIDPNHIQSESIAITASLI